MYMYAQMKVVVWRDAVRRIKSMHHEVVVITKNLLMLLANHISFLLGGWIQSRRLGAKTKIPPALGATLACRHHGGLQ